MNNKYFLTSILALCAQFSTHALSTLEGEIVDKQNQKIELKGVNWFGFNNGGTMVDGLWNPSNPISADFSSVARRIKALGFNAVRLPFSFSDFKKNPRDYNHTYCKIPNDEDILKSIQKNNFVHTLSLDQNINTQTCNSYLPNNSTLDRFIWVVNYLTQNGFYVLIDNHLREDQTLLTQGLDTWVNEWKNLIQKINDFNPKIQEHLMIDLLNEPDNFGLKWEDNAHIGLTKAYIAAMDALHPLVPEALFFIEGTGQGNINANWGDGFATDESVIKSKGLSDPNPFFLSLINKNYVNKVVVSPHVYPVSVTSNSNDSTGVGLFNRMSTSFGYLNKTGYCKSNTQCFKFPIAIGEFGSKFEEAEDLKFMKDFKSYLLNVDTGADSKHNKISNWFYWSWNANSGDTGGLVDNGWYNLEWKKIDYLKEINL